MPELTLNLNQSLEDNLDKNNIKPPTGGRRRKIRGGDETNPAPAPAPEADQKKVVTISLLKGAFDYLLNTGVKVGTIVGEVAVAGALVYAANQYFGPDVCTPLYGSVSKTIATYIPIAAGPALKCDASASAYHTAVSTAILAATPIIIDAFKRAGKLVLSDEQVEQIGGDIVETIQNPPAAATAVFSSMTRNRRGSIGGPQSKALPPPPPNTGKRGQQAAPAFFSLPETGGRRTRNKKRGLKKARKTRRGVRTPLFKY